jgi:hypothetical protein
MKSTPDVWFEQGNALADESIRVRSTGVAA